MNSSEFQQEQRLVDSVTKTIGKQISKIEGETGQRRKKSFIFVNTFGTKSR